MFARSAGPSPCHESPRGRVRASLVPGSGCRGRVLPAVSSRSGLSESRFPSRRLHRLVNGYVTFWSDTARRYAAQAMFLVRAGDTISASLTLSNGVWSLAIVDRTRYRSAHVSVADEGRASFNQADWTKENPGTSNNHEQYPQVAAPVFEHVTVNATPLTASDPSLYSQWMSVNHHNLAPTALDDASFTLQRAPALSTDGRTVRATVSPGGDRVREIRSRTHALDTEDALPHDPRRQLDTGPSDTSARARRARRKVASADPRAPALIEPRDNDVPRGHSATRDPDPRHVRSLELDPDRSKRTGRQGGAAAASDAGTPNGRKRRQLRTTVNVARHSLNQPPTPRTASPTRPKHGFGRKPRQRLESHSSSIARVNRICRPIRRHGSLPVRTAS